jgi:hypothetical protein
MMNEKLIFLLLVGMLLYKALDMWANQLKIRQTLLRVERIVGSREAGVAARRSVYRLLRERQHPRDFARRLVRQYGQLDRLNVNYREVLMTVVFLVLAVLVIGGQILDLRARESSIVAVATIAVSAVSSLIAVMIEALRDLIERA